MKTLRTKLSTTVAAENYNYLAGRVSSGRSGSLAEAVDEAIENLRRSENRARLAKATVDYYSSLSSEAMQEEKELTESLRHAAENIDFDREL